MTDVSVVVPSVNSILGRRVSDEQRSHALSRAWMFGMAGFFAGPAMMGFVGEYFGLRLAFFAVSVVVAVIIPAIVALRRIDRA